MSTVLALVLGLGVFLVYDALTSPRAGGPSSPRPGRVMSRVARLIAEAGLDSVTPPQLLAASVGSGVLAAAVTYALVGSGGVAAAALLGASYVPVAYLRGRRRARQRAHSRCWPEAVELLAGAVRAGDTLVGALGVVAERGPEPLRPAFRSLVNDHRVSGDLDRALARFSASVADPVGDRVAATLTVAHRVGGRELGRVLRTLAEFLREDLAMRREVESRQSWTLVAARVAAAAPWIVLVLVASRDQARHAYDTPAGLMVLAVGAAVTVAGYRLMLALGRIPEPARLSGTAP